MIEEEDHEESEEISQYEELVISEESFIEAQKQFLAPIAKDMDVQAIDAYIKEESKKFEMAEKIIAEVLPEEKQTTCRVTIRDSRLIYAKKDWCKNKLKFP